MNQNADMQLLLESEAVASAANQPQPGSVPLPSETARKAVGRASRKRNLSPDQLKEVFWSRVKKGSKDECWLSDYSHFTFLGKRSLVSKLAFLFSGGVNEEIPNRLYHKCQVTSCCNPAHLFASGSSKQSRINNILEFNSWAAMVARCKNPKNPQWKDYGGRGIKVCKRWLKFSNFLEDMAPRTSPNHSIDRIDNDGNYEKSNCQWSVRKVQNRNHRRSVFATFNGKSQCLTAWSEELGIHRSTLQHRFKTGKPLIFKRNYKDEVIRRRLRKSAHHNP